MSFGKKCKLTYEVYKFQKFICWCPLEHMTDKSVGWIHWHDWKSCEFNTTRATSEVNKNLEIAVGMFSVGMSEVWTKLGPNGLFCYSETYNDLGLFDIHRVYRRGEGIEEKLTNYFV